MKPGGDQCTRPAITIGGNVKLYEFVVWCDEKVDKDGDVVEEATVIAGPSVMLANDENTVGLKASKTIPDEYDSKLERVRVNIRPF